MTICQDQDSIRVMAGYRSNGLSTTKLKQRVELSVEFLREESGGATRSRTEIDGFAIRSIAILPSRHFGR